MKCKGELDQLYFDLSKIGVATVVNSDRISKNHRVDIENLIVRCAASMADDLDGRLASLIFSWLDVYSKYVIVEKLKKLKFQYERLTGKDLVWISAMAHYCYKEKKQHKWKVLALKFNAAFYLPPEDVSRQFCEFKGVYPWLASTGLFIAKGSLRIREEDVIAPEVLAQKNSQFRNRLLFGPAWRADIVTAIQQGARRPKEICEMTQCSSEPARRILMDYQKAVALT